MQESIIWPTRKALNYAKVMHPAHYKAFLSWCRNPKAEKPIRAWEAEIGEIAHAGALMRSHAEGGVTYEAARAACLRAIIIKDLL